MGTVLDLNEVDYHADPCPSPSLSHSIAKILVTRSPAHAYHQHPKLGKGAPRVCEEFDRGHLIHKLVLGAGAQIKIIHADDWRTKAAREERDAARAAGMIPALAWAHEEAVKAADVIRAKLGAANVDLSGDVEVSITWQEETKHGPIWCRARPDLVDLSRGAIFDLKSCQSAHPRDCAKAVPNYGYDIQCAAYTHAVASAQPELDGAISFTFGFCELEPPYGVAVVELDGTLREYGERRWKRACETWARCLRDGHWPAYEDATRLDAPGWVLAALDEEMAR